MLVCVFSKVEPHEHWQNARHKIHLKPTSGKSNLGKNATSPCRYRTLTLSSASLSRESEIAEDSLRLDELGVDGDSNIITHQKTAGL